MTKEELKVKVDKQLSIINDANDEICSYVNDYIESLPYKVGDKVSCSRCDVCWIKSIVPETSCSGYTGKIEVRINLLRKMALAPIESLYYGVRKLIVSKRLVNHPAKDIIDSNMSDNVITSYKGFDKDMKCRNFQYEVGKEYEMDGEIKCCNRGFHACKSPMEVWDYYDMLNSRYAEVEQSGKIDKEENSTKVCSSRIKIKAELKQADIINIGVEWLKDITSPSKVKMNGVLNDYGDRKKQIGSSGDYAQIGSSGDYAQIGSSGDYAKIGSSGDYAQIGSSGDSAKIGSSGYYAKIGSSGYYAQIGSSGDYAQIGSSGYYAQIGSSGDYAQIGSSGDSAKIDSTGEDTVIMCAGNKSKAKAKVGSWITLAEWKWNDEKNRNVPVCVKTEYVDGVNVKADTWYQLKNGKFVEVTE